MTINPLWLEWLQRLYLYVHFRKASSKVALRLGGLMKTSLQTALVDPTALSGLEFPKRIPGNPDFLTASVSSLSATLHTALSSLQSTIIFDQRTEINLYSTLARIAPYSSSMHRPYLHFDRITKVHQALHQAKEYAQPKRKHTGLLDLPLELRLDIYRELRTPASNWQGNFHGLDWHGHEARAPSKFPVEMLLLNRQINEEVKIIYYGDSVYSIAIDTEDEKRGFNAVAEDRNRRLDMLRFVKKASISIQMAGESAWNWKHPGSKQESVDYIRDSITRLCRDFASARLLKSIEISYRDHLSLHSWVPDDSDDDPEDSSISRSELSMVGHEHYQYIAHGIHTLPSEISVTPGNIDVLNVTESEFADWVQELEDKFMTAFFSWDVLI